MKNSVLVHLNGIPADLAAEYTAAPDPSKPYATNYEYERMVKHGVFADCYERSIPVARAIAEVLPQGSGINYDWHIRQGYTLNKMAVWSCENKFDAMDAAGGYCHAYAFSTTIACRLYGWETGKPENAVIVLDLDVVRLFPDNPDCECGAGLKEYLQDTFFFAFGPTLTPNDFQVTFDW